MTVEGFFSHIYSLVAPLVGAFLGAAGTNLFNRWSKPYTHDLAVFEKMKSDFSDDMLYHVKHTEGRYLRTEVLEAIFSLYNYKWISNDYQFQNRTLAKIKVELMLELKDLISFIGTNTSRGRIEKADYGSKDYLPDEAYKRFLSDRKGLDDRLGSFATAYEKMWKKCIKKLNVERYS